MSEIWIPGPCVELRITRVIAFTKLNRLICMFQGSSKQMFLLPGFGPPLDWRSFTVEELPVATFTTPRKWRAFRITSSGGKCIFDPQERDEGFKISNPKWHEVRKWQPYLRYGWSYSTRFVSLPFTRARYSSQVANDVFCHSTSSLWRHETFRT